MVKLKHRDKLYLLRVGYTKEEIPDIEQNDFRYVKDFDRSITEDVAAKFVGRESWLSGVARACFHRTAVRDCLMGNSVIYIERL